MNKAITYSILTHVRNTGTLIKGPIDIFVPLIKRTLYKLSEEGITKGNNIFQIKTFADNLYSIDFPIPVLKIILEKIAFELNSDTIKFQVYKDGSFIINNYIFLDFEEKIQEYKSSIDNLENLFIDFCKVYNLNNCNQESIIEFISKNKLTIGKYLYINNRQNNPNYTIEAQFVTYFKKIPQIYDLIKDIYLGSILSTYLDYRPENKFSNIEFLLDTNFIISLIDLNTEESTHTCNKLLEIGKILGCKFTILKDTIDETQRLLEKRAEKFDFSFLQKRINPEDIYNACERRKLNKSDLERIADNLESLLINLRIFIIPETTKYKNLAKNSKEFYYFKPFRNNDQAALHDAMAIYYVRDKRGKKIKDFEKVNCWFVNNATNHEKIQTEENENNTNKIQPEFIKADELLNILWLSNPVISKSISTNDIIEMGLNSLLSVTLNESLPKSSIIRELDENIQKYAKENLSEKDIFNISTRIVHRQLKDIQDLNELAITNKTEFIDKLKIESEKQEKIDNDRLELINNLFKKVEQSQKDYEKKNEEIEKKINEFEKNEIIRNSEISTLETKNEIEVKKRIIIDNKYRKLKREELINSKLKKWRRRTWYEFSFCIVVFVISIIIMFYISNWDINIAYQKYQIYQKNLIFITLLGFFGMIFTGIVLVTLILKYRNYTNIEAFKRTIEIPEEYKELN